MDTKRWGEVISRLDQTMNQGDVPARLALGFKPLDKVGGERHGSWVWTWWRFPAEADHLTCYASIALTEKTPPGPVPTYLVEILAGADDQRRFHQLLVSGHQYDGFESLISDIDGLGADFQQAMQMAQALTPEDFTETYPRVGRRG